MVASRPFQHLTAALTFTTSSKQISMGTRSNQYQHTLCQFINEQPIRFNVTFARSFVAAHKGMIAVFWF